MRKIAAKAILFYGLILVGGLYTAFVLMNLWDWFVAPSFNLSPIPFLMMFGLTLVVNTFRVSDSEIEHRRNQQKLETILDWCVPEQQRENVKKDLEEIDGHIWRDSGFGIVGHIVGNTFALGLGFVIHILA